MRLPIVLLAYLIYSDGRLNVDPSHSTRKAHFDDTSYLSNLDRQYAGLVETHYSFILRFLRGKCRNWRIVQNRSL